MAITLTYAALLLAVTLDHGVKMLVRRGLKRSLAIALVSVSLAGVLTGLGFTLIPPAISQGKTLVAQAPILIHTARASRLFDRLDARFHLADHILDLLQVSRSAGAPRFQCGHFLFQHDDLIAGRGMGRGGHFFLLSLKKQTRGTSKVSPVPRH